MKKIITTLFLISISASLVFASAITRDEAKSIALKEAGFSSSEVSRLRASTDHDDGIKYFEVSFNRGEYEYDYDILEEGTIDSKSFELRKRVKQDKSAPLLSVEEVEKIALKLTGSDNARISKELDDGIRIYEIDAITNEGRFEIEIDGVTGKIISYSLDF